MTCDALQIIVIKWLASQHSPLSTTNTLLGAIISAKRLHGMLAAKTMCKQHLSGQKTSKADMCLKPVSASSVWRIEVRFSIDKPFVTKNRRLPSELWTSC